MNEHITNEPEMKNEQNETPEELTNESRRNFLKLGAAGAGLAAVAAGGITVVKRMEGLPLDHFPLPINDEYARIDQRNQINTNGTTMTFGVCAILSQSAMNGCSSMKASSTAAKPAPDAAICST